MSSIKPVFGIRESRDIVVTIPKAKQAEIEAEEADVARRLGEGETDIGYFWAMGRLPKEQPRRIYFAWEGAVRAYHEVTGMGDGKIFMRPEIHELPSPRKMESFRGFRYFKEEK
jgi:hypothetical protein